MHLTDTTICGLASDALALELENKPGLVSKVVLIVVARGDVVNEACQKVIGFYGPDSQVRGDLEIDASTNHHIKGPIARRPENAPDAILMDSRAIIGMCDSHQPLKQGLGALQTNLYCRPHIRGD